MEKSPHNYSYIIQEQNLDFNRECRFTRLADYILDAACEDADKIGVGLRDLNQQNCSWVLSKMAITLDRSPRQYENIIIGTWVNEINRMMTIRNFTIQTVDGESIGKATTHWAMINMTTRRALDLSAHKDYARAIIDIPTPVTIPVKVGLFAATDYRLHKVAYSDIDVNQHANTIKYIQWMTDCLDLEWYRENSIREFVVNFHHEAIFGETLHIGCLKEAETVRFDIKNDKNISICRAQIKCSKHENKI